MWLERKGGGADERRLSEDRCATCVVKGGGSTGCGKGPNSIQDAGRTPSGAKARRLFCDTYGTTEVVP